MARKHVIVCSIVSAIAALMSAVPSNAGEPVRPALATFELHSKIYLVSPHSKVDPAAVSAWLLTMDSNAVQFSPKLFQTNLASNAEKFCGGGTWRAFHKKLESGHLEAGFVCLDGKAETMKHAAVKQQLTVIDAGTFVRR
ncbi:MAG: hypothetical protein ABJ388_00270 [Alphaproteobacteria bacterium]|uniref:hypothetical protein n=1 Tax=Roseibium sp. TaxID=1936156 RepID=UPI0032912D95